VSTTPHGRATLRTTGGPAPDEAALVAIIRSGVVARQRLRAQVALARRWRERGAYRRAGLLLTLTLSAADGDADTAAHAANEIGLLGKYCGQFDRAEAHYRLALRLYRELYGEDNDWVATIYHNLGGLAHARRQPEAGEPLARYGLQLRIRLHGADDPRVATDRAAWSALLADCGRLDEAEAELTSALAALGRLAGQEYEVASITHNLAALRHRRGDLTGAAQGYAAALRLKETLLGPLHPDLAATLVNLSAVSPDQAHAGYTRAVEILNRAVEADHPTLAAARRGLQSTMDRSG
jgi:tetratricopeptide (TPR) repeat protein